MIDTKYKNADLHKTINESCQHITVTKQAELLTLLKKYEGLFYASLGTWDIEPVYFEL